MPPTRTTPIDINRPEEGWFEIQLVKNGRPVGVRIWWERGEREPCDACQPPGGEPPGGGGRRVCVVCDGVGSWLSSDDVLHATQDGETVDAWWIWPRAAAHPIEEDRFDFLIKDSEHLKQHDPNNPEADPRKPVELSKTRMPY